MAQDLPDNWPESYGTKTLIDWQFNTAAALDIPAYVQDAPRASGPQGKVEPLTVVKDPAAWYSKQWLEDKSWIYQLTSQDIEELDAAIAKAKRKQLDIKDVRKDTFPLPNLGPKLVKIAHEVSHGRGFQLLRGIPVMRYSIEESLLAAWGLGLYWGNHQVQDKLGQLISHVKDNGTNPNGIHTRAYTTSSAQPLHNDYADIVGLLCLRKAREGGLSTWSSQITAHNEMLLRGRKDLVEVLAGGEWWLHKSGWNCEGGNLDSYYNHPIVAYHESNKAVPRMTAKEIEAISLYTALSMSKELRMDWDLQPGDFQLLHNCSMCHSRTGFINGKIEDETRHLLRVWVANEDERPLPDVFKWQWGSTKPDTLKKLWVKRL